MTAPVTTAFMAALVAFAAGLTGSPASAQARPIPAGPPAPAQVRSIPPGQPPPAGPMLSTGHAVRAAQARPATLGAVPLSPAAIQPAAGRPASDTVPVPIVLPRAVPITNAASSTLFSAMLAIARARQIDPQAAQIASFQYTQAVQQYRSGNIAGAQASALAALSTAGGAQVRPVNPAPIPAPSLPAARAQVPGLAGGLYGADAPAIDADAFLALARGMLEDCAARRDARLAGAQQRFAQAQQDFAQRNWQATRVDAKAAIDACAKAER